MKRLLFLPAVLVAVLCAAAPPVVAQQAPFNLQEQAEQKFQDLHDRMQELQTILAATDPEDSKILRAGNRYIQEARIHEDMSRIKMLIAGDEWDEALEQMQSVRTELVQLMELLLNKDLDLKRLMEEIARLEAFKDRVNDLIEDQPAEKEDAARTEALEQHIKNLEKAKADAEAILAAQKDLREQTNQAGMAAEPKAAEEMAGKEGDLKDQAENLAKKLEDLETEGKELESGKGSKPGEGKSGAGKPGEGKPGEGKSSGTCSQCAGGAAQSMGKAQEKLEANKPESSLKDQDHAIEQLQKAIDELEELVADAERKLKQLPFEQQVRAQEQTKVDTDTLAKDMEKAEQPGEGDEQGKPVPGKKNVQQAVPKQKAAAGMLKEYKAGKAKQKQQDAKEDLEQARQDLEDALAQLRQELQDEILRALEERFGAMLARQKELSTLTKAVDKVRGEAVAMTANGGLPASLVERCQEIGEGEFELAMEAHDALKLLEEEGTTAVFPAMTEELRDDLKAVSRLVRGNATGRNVQSRQVEIEEMLRMLINALRRTIELKEGGGST